MIILLRGVENLTHEIEGISITGVVKPCILSNDNRGKHSNIKTTRVRILWSYGQIFLFITDKLDK